MSEETIARAKIVHASTWPLSREPSRSAVAKAFKPASEQGKTVSLDPNYTTVVWPDYHKAQKVMGVYAVT